MNNFWRLLTNKENLGIYIRNYTVHKGSYYDAYNTLIDNNGNYADIAIFSGATLKIQIYSTSQNVSIGKAVLQFINTRYDLSLTYTELLNYITVNEDIGHQKKLFDFILEKETALEKTPEKSNPLSFPLP